MRDRAWAQSVIERLMEGERRRRRVQNMGLIGSVPGFPGVWITVRVDGDARALQEEYMAWRREPRVDPAAGPEPHPLAPTAYQQNLLGYWWSLLSEREDMAGLGFPQNEEGFRVGPTPAAAVDPSRSEQ